MLMLLLMMVSVGLVLGATEPMTPNGGIQKYHAAVTGQRGGGEITSTPGVLSSAALF